MAKQIPIKSTGQIIEALGNSIFKVMLDNGHEIIAHISGKIRINNIKLIIKDKVEIELSPYDLTRGRICRRL
ncbi:MAG: translation initiation factor IF-1 [Clostridia bacterium]